MIAVWCAKLCRHVLLVANRMLHGWAKVIIYNLPVDWQSLGQAFGLIMLS
jgi:hypothetical protein